VCITDLQSFSTGFAWILSIR